MLLFSSAVWAFRTLPRINPSPSLMSVSFRNDPTRAAHALPQVCSCSFSAHVPPLRRIHFFKYRFTSLFESHLFLSFFELHVTPSYVIGFNDTVFSRESPPLLRPKTSLKMLSGPNPSPGQILLHSFFQTSPSVLSSRSGPLTNAPFPVSPEIQSSVAIGPESTLINPLGVTRQVLKSFACLTIKAR